MAMEVNEFKWIKNWHTQSIQTIGTSIQITTQVAETNIPYTKLIMRDIVREIKPGGFTGEVTKIEYLVLKSN